MGEMTMCQSSTRTKLGELQSHKKILKKEVIDLRKKMEETNSELDLYRHRESSVKLKVEQERQKSKLLERYVDKIESQVKVQQNMMEMMSQAGSVYGGSVYGGSVYGGAVGSQFGSLPPSLPPTMVRANGISNNPTSSRSVEKNYTTTSRTPEYDDIIGNRGREVADDEEEENVLGSQLNRSRQRGRKSVDDVDNKSHMSELTEERTQKQFDAAMMIYSSSPQLRATISGSPRMGPPAIIGIAEESTGEQQSSGASYGQKLDTIMSTSRPSSRPPSGTNSGRDFSRTLAPPIESSSRSSGLRDTSFDRSMNDSSSSIGSISRSKPMTVAQRARLDADRQSTPVRIRLNQTPLRGNSSGSYIKEGKPRDSSSVSSNQSNGFFSKIGKNFENALDNSVLGVKFEDGCSNEDNLRYPISDVQTGLNTASVQDEKKMSDHASVASTKVSLSLVERQALQRARQLNFLKEQGLINKESDVKGGAGSDTNSVCSRSSHQRQSPRIKS